MKNEMDIDPEIEKAWAEEAERRLTELEEGKVEPIPGEQVMDGLKNITGE
ncbi:addiction module protein [Fodinibius halophilus]|uniref:Addiction module protein n=1 Tax=Fodinibius halophilus TaxID=1736908 RepID=A0A6M1TFZ9_9BACT|nr:addiction module protein [Fodinibius halophilus]NGP87560.1 addiction module protein [Fodinibius halophilus]